MRWLYWCILKNFHIEMTPLNTYKNLSFTMMYSIEYLQESSKCGGSIKYFEELPQWDDSI